MIPILYETISEGTVPSHFGLGALTDTIMAEVRESRNGEFELELTYSASGIHAEDIQPNRFIKVKPNYTDDPQIFRIYKVGKTMNGRFQVFGQHISYDLSGKVITSGTASSCSAACSLLTAKAGNFVIDTDKTTSGAFVISAPSSVRSWFGGKEGSLLDVYGGEWKYDNYTASLKSARGTDRGVQIRYGKNLTELSQEIDMSNLVTGIIPYYIDGNGNKIIGSKVSTGLVLDVPRDEAIDFSSDVNPESSTPIATQLANLATRYKNNNNLTSALNSITLDFVQSGELTERVDLCDTVHIYFEALGISASMKCIETVWDVLNERYTSTTFGSARANIADTIAQATKELELTASRDFVSHATELITGNLGGYVVLHDSDNDGKPDEILIMNTEDVSTATKVWRWNKNGLGYATSYSGPYDTLALTNDGKIVATAITTGTLNANLIKAGVISDVAGNSSIDMTNGKATMKDFVAKNSLKFIDNNNIVLIYMQPDTDGGLIAIGDTVGVPRAMMVVDSCGGRFDVLNTSGNTTGQYGVDQDGGGILILQDENNVPNVLAYGTNGIVICVQLIQTSSRKTKENIKPIKDARKILELEAVSFDYKNKTLGVDRRGFIAEDVEKILPNLVSPETEKTPASLDYIQMIPYLQTVIKDQEKRIQALEEKINNLGG